MSLLVTSCTMGKQPGRLLNKGPQYLRTRTNASLFGQQRKTSAVELLAASKTQFYSSKPSVELDTQQDLAVTVGQRVRYTKDRDNSTQKEPPRSRSEYDLSHSQLAKTDYENDENNNDTSDDSINFCGDDALQNNTLLRLKEDSTTQHIVKSEGAKRSVSVVDSCSKLEDLLAYVPTEISTGHHNSKPQSRITFLRSASAPGNVNDHIYDNVAVQSEIHGVGDEVDDTVIKKPVPLPRKSKVKPIPPPRRFSTRTAIDVTTHDSGLFLSEAASSSITLHKPSLSSQFPSQETAQFKTQTSSTDTETDAGNKHSIVESLTEQFTALSATFPSPKSEKSHLLYKAEKSPEVTPEVTGTFTATPVFIYNTDSCSPSYQAKRVFITEDCVSGCITPVTNRVLDTFYVSNKNLTINKCRKRCPDVSASASAVKRERRSITSDRSYSKPGFVASKSVPLNTSYSLSTPRSEMSIESADQAVCESEINAIPTASMEAENMRGQGSWTREVTRSNSSLSGKMESQDVSPLSMSSTPHCSLVPRSHSDIACCLENQHSRDISLVSNHSRLSRASIGADLENFFNQMGLEKGVLEPMSRLRELQAGEVFDSMSSLDSHDAASICSTFSRSEPEWSDSQSMDRSQQQTSIVERNARIIKWLCNVRKAKSPIQKSNSVATGTT